MKLFAMAAVGGLSLAMVAVPALAQSSVAGRWITEDGHAVVEIGPCGDAVCGRVVKFLVMPPEGRGQRDVNNPDPKLRDRTVLGMAVLTDFHPYKDNQWKGDIYDPEGGKTYSARLERIAPDRLKLKGCVAIFCKSQIWKRAPS